MAVAADGSRKRVGSGSGENQLGKNDSGDINLRETEETGVICVGIVDGTSTPPNLSIAINGQDRNQYFIAAEEAKVGGINVIWLVDGNGGDQRELSLLKRCLYLGNKGPEISEFRVAILTF